MAVPDPRRHARVRARRRGEAGFSITEVLIAAAVLVVVLGIVAIYFGQQATLTKRTQARSDTQDRARLVMQLLTQDLSLTGGKTYIRSDGSMDLTASLAKCPDYTDPTSGHLISPCLLVVNNGVQDSLSMMYVNSLRSTTDACRTVAYRFNGNTLERYDASFSCTTGTSLVDPSSTSLTFNPIADDILAVDVALTCSSSTATGTTLAQYPDEASCPYGSAYPRSATVTVVAESKIPVPGTASRVIDTSTDGITGETGKVTCPTDRFCYEITQQVLLPNLKEG